MANKFTDFNPSKSGLDGGRKNFIINGATRIWQRGTSAINITSSNGAFLADRFRGVNVTDGTLTYTRGTSNYPNANFREYIWLGTGVADASLGATQTVGLQYVIEGFDIIPLIGKTCTLSFWAWAAVAGTYCVAFTNYSGGSSDRSYVVEYTLSAGSSFEYKTITFTMHDLLSGSNWNTTNGAGLRIWWTYCCGSSYNTSSTNSWLSGTYISTSNQVNLMANTSYGFGITGVQLELGAVATPFENRTTAEELELCQRYYEKSYDLVTAPGGAGVLTGEEVFIAPITGVCYPKYSYKVRKRSDANPYVYSCTTGAVGYIRDLSAGADVAITPQIASETSNLFSASVTDQRLYVYQWVGESELV